MAWHSELSVFKKIKFVGKISSNYPDGLLGTNVYRTLESCWQSVLTMLQWTSTNSVISDYYHLRFQSFEM